MRDFVEDVWKFASACAAGAFLLSLVIGLIVGNPFGVAFFRGLLMAALFAGLAAGLRFLVRAYLPELIEASGAPSGGAKSRTEPAAAGSSRGSAVDIELPEDDELRRQTYGAGAEASARNGAGSPDDEPEEAQEAESLDEDAGSPAEAQALGDLAQELAEEMPAAPDSAATGRGSGAESASGGADEGAAEEVEMEDELPGPGHGSSGGLDSLPDIAALEAPEGSPGRASPRMPGPSAGESPRDALRSSVSGQDPLTLARAIRTALKKDEKG